MKYLGFEPECTMEQGRQAGTQEEAEPGRVDEALGIFHRIYWMHECKLPNTRLGLKRVAG